MWDQASRIMSQAASRIADNIANFLPRALVAVVLVAAASVAALIARYLVLRILRATDFDRRADRWGLWDPAGWSPTRSPSQLVARAISWTVLVVGLLVALTALDAAMTTRFALALIGYVPNLLAAFVILLVGGVLSRFLARSVLIGAVNLQMQSARLLSAGVKWLVLVLAAAMALEHLGIGRQILLLAFGLLFGGIVLAMALAVGLGSKDVVSRSWERLQDHEAHDREDRLDHR